MSGQGETFNLIVDVDDVLFPFSTTAHALCERAGMTNGKAITQWNMHLDYGITAEELWAFLHDDKTLVELYSAWPVPGALEQLRRLRYQGHRVHLVTARGPLVEPVTRDWIRTFNVPLDSLTFTKDKAAFADEIEAHFGLDDGAHNYMALADAGVQVYLHNQPHNQGFQQHRGATVRRVDSVRQFADTVLALQDYAARWIGGLAA